LCQKVENKFFSQADLLVFEDFHGDFLSNMKVKRVCIPFHPQIHQCH